MLADEGVLWRGFCQRGASVLLQISPLTYDGSSRPAVALSFILIPPGVASWKLEAVVRGQHCHVSRQRQGVQEKRSDSLQCCAPQQPLKRDIHQPDCWNDCMFGLRSCCDTKQNAKCKHASTTKRPLGGRPRLVLLDITSHAQKNRLLEGMSSAMGFLNLEVLCKHFRVKWIRSIEGKWVCRTLSQAKTRCVSLHVR